MPPQSTEQIRLVKVDPQDPRAKACLEGYYAELVARFPSGFEPDAGQDPGADAMRPPNGTFLLAIQSDTPVACGALRRSRGAAGEVKRVWVSPPARGAGLARRLMAEIETAARQMGLQRLQLDTSRHLPEARRLYLSLGYREIDRYNDNPYADHFFEKDLGAEVT